MFLFFPLARHYANSPAFTGERWLSPPERIFLIKGMRVLTGAQFYSVKAAGNINTSYPVDWHLCT